MGRVCLIHRMRPMPRPGLQLQRRRARAPLLGEVGVAYARVAKLVLLLISIR
jgi:hypothetical protein